MDTYPIQGASERYVEWMARLRKAGLVKAEQLLPQLRVPCPTALPHLMTHGGSRKVNLDALRQEVASHRPWGYGIQLAPGVATEPSLVALQRMIYRSHLISGAVGQLLGDERPDCTLVDFACNHGYFTLENAFLGMRQCTGLDLRAENVAKAEFLKRHFRIENANFVQQDIYDLDSSQKFDVVLNLGVMYHITDPWSLVKLSYDMCKRFAVLDTIMHKEPFSGYVQRVNKDTAKHAEGKFEMELHPTYRACIDLMHAVGFHDVIEIVPDQADPALRCPHELYDRFDRRCLIGFKEPGALEDLDLRLPPLDARVL
jgi:2-polyprenyl-3-methyl-5-hydroxy-6-metoxy-1,4-benzoquinol methylase